MTWLTALAWCLVAAALVGPARGAGDADLCHACRATVTEVDKALTAKGSRRGESDVMDALAGVCSMQSFRVYDFPPPKMIKLCQRVLDAEEEAFERVFTRAGKAGKVAEIQEKVCGRAFCEGVDVNKKRPTGKPQVFMDGEPVNTEDSVQLPPRKKKKKKKSKKKTKKPKKPKKKTKNKKKKKKGKSSKSEL